MDEMVSWESSEPRSNEMGHEVGLIISVTSGKPEIAKAIAKSFAHFALHYPIPEWKGID